MLYTKSNSTGVANHTNNSYAPFLLECLHLENPNGPSLQRSVRTSSLWYWNATFFLSTKEVMWYYFRKAKKQHYTGKSWQVNLCTLKANPAILIHPYNNARLFTSFCQSLLSFNPSDSPAKLTGRYRTPHFPSCTIFQS